MVTPHVLDRDKKVTSERDTVPADAVDVGCTDGYGSPRWSPSIRTGTAIAGFILFVPFYL